MFEDYSERLFAHYVGGRWRAPYGCVALTVRGQGGSALGQVVLAGARDISRAMAQRTAADDAARARLVQSVHEALPDLALALSLQTGQMPETTRLDGLVRGLKSVCEGTPELVLGTQTSSPEMLGRALGAGLRGGVIWCPPPEHAVFATAIAQLMQASDLPAGAFALLHTRAPSTEALLRATALQIADI